MDKTYQVLLVEDDSTMAQVVQDMMRLAPCRTEIKVISSGDDALKVIQQRKPDLLILDLMLPGMSGQELLRALHTNPEFAGLPVVVNSTIADSQWTKREVEACQNLRVAIVPRPCSHEQLISGVKSALGIS